MNVVELVAKLGLKVDEGDFQKGAAAIGGLKSGLAAIGLSVGAAKVALEAIIATTAAYGNAAAKSAQRIGMNAVAFQEIVEAADDVQIAAGSVEAGLRFLGRNAYEASQGGAEAAAAFRELGVAVKDSAGKLRGTDAILMDLADRFAKMPDGPAKTALAMKVLGRGGTEMIPLLNKGSAAIAEMREGARELGLVLSQDAVDASVEYTEALDGLHDAITGIKRTLGAAFMKDATSVIRSMAAWVTENRKLIATRIQAFVEGFSVALRRVRQVLEPFGRLLLAIVSNSTIWKGLLVAIGVLALAQFGNAVAGAVGALGTMLTAVRAVTAAQVLGAAASLATGLLWAAGIALVAMAIEELYGWFTGDRETLLGRWLGTFEQFAERNAFGRMLKDWLDTLERLKLLWSEARVFFGGEMGPTERRMREDATSLAKAYEVVGATGMQTQWELAKNPRFSQLSRAGDWSTLAREFGPGAGAGVPATVNLNMPPPPVGVDPIEWSSWGAAVREEVDRALQAAIAPAYEAAPLAGGGGG